ncbi:hypothetical protein B0H12DRAFT_1079755 [Mycena haematopus]|nr:hypothetical protein B0H12DRAFT_1079755 [Mycena haematopus]
MEFPSLLLSTYGAEISFDLNISTITMPGVAVAGKLVIVQISKELIVLMVGVIGHKKPLFCLADWSTTKTEVEAVSQWRYCSKLPARGQAADSSSESGGFLGSGLSHFEVVINCGTSDGFSFDAQYHDHVMGMFEFFEADAGREVCTGDGVCEPSDDHPPGYTDPQFLKDRRGNCERSEQFYPSREGAQG